MCVATLVTAIDDVVDLVCARFFNQRPSAAHRAVHTHFKPLSIDDTA